MKRVIKFRGKSLAGDWEFGDLSQWNEEDGRKRTFISLEGLEPVEVKPDTVGQFTGLHDKDGKEVYEGDIVSYVFKGHKVKDVIGWQKQCAMFDFIPCTGRLCTYQTLVKSTVIGNIHDNQDLLKGGAE